MMSVIFQLAVYLMNSVVEIVDIEMWRSTRTLEIEAEKKRMIEMRVCLI